MNEDKTVEGQVTGELNMQEKLLEELKQNQQILEKYTKKFDILEKKIDKLDKNNQTVLDLQKKINLLNEELAGADEEIAKKALEIEPEFVAAWNNIGNSFFKKDDIKKAKKAYKKALEINPNFEEPYLFHP